MRMWMLEARFLCNSHILGEHSELHKHKHNFVKGHKMTGRISPIVQIEPSSMQTRHDELAAEMLARGLNHKSPYEQPDLGKYSSEVINAKVDLEVSKNTLIERCEKCRQRILESN